MRVMESWMNRSLRMQRLVTRLKARGWRDLETSANPCFTDALLLSPCGTMVAKFAGYGGWRDFIEWAAKNPSPYLPRVYKLRRIADKRSGESIVYAIMERLHDLPYEGSAWGYLPRKGAPKAEAALVRVAREITGKSGEYRTDYKVRGAIANVMQSMVAALGVPGDLHGKNMMVRKGPRGGIRDLVLLDPYA